MENEIDVVTVRIVIERDNPKLGMRIIVEMNNDIEAMNVDTGEYRDSRAMLARLAERLVENDAPTSNMVSAIHDFVVSNVPDQPDTTDHQTTPRRIDGN